jgi:SAM-dependent methyltransferase
VRLALLLKASSNRVYGAVAPQLGWGELLVLDRHALGSIVEAVDIASLGGVDYLVVDVGDTVLDARLLALLSNLSSLHALFAVEGEVLRPLALSPRRCVDEDIVTIQRYAGKTNEAFTHLLVNLALAVGGAFERLLDGDRVRLLDPACGRGTTLNRAMVYGADALGLELDGRDVEAYGTFLLTWLQDKRLKHTVERATLRKGRPAPAHRLTVRYGRGKDREAHRVVDVVHDDTVRIRDHVPARSVDAIACDLPYGVQHGSRPATGALDRRPEQLLADALPAWCDVLRPGGGMALGWNTHTLRRPALLEQLVAAGLEVLDVPDGVTFAHRVDRAIVRDVVLARRPR